MTTISPITTQMPPYSRSSGILALNGESADAGAWSRNYLPSNTTFIAELPDQAIVLDGHAGVDVYPISSAIGTQAWYQLVTATAVYDSAGSRKGYQLAWFGSGPTASAFGDANLVVPGVDTDDLTWYYSTGFSFVANQLAGDHNTVIGNDVQAVTIPPAHVIIPDLRGVDALIPDIFTINGRGHLAYRLRT